jgi:pimeloyl-ACP methyl ester carboxylesterase
MTDAPPLQRVELDCGTASYREAGDGPAVVMVAGLGLSSRFYAASYATFSRAGLRLIIPDLPGTGETDGPATGIDASRTAEFVQQFMTAIGLRTAVLVGHSLGTQAVLLVAVHAPDMVRGIVLAGPTGPDRGGTLLHQARGIALESTRAGAAALAAVAREYVRNSPVRYLGTWYRHRDALPETRISEITCPALLLIGGRDAVTSARYTAFLRDTLPDVMVTELLHATHAFPLSQHEDFDTAVIEFVKRLNR